MTTKLTIHDACEGKSILLTDPDMNLIFAWNGSATFTVYQESGLEYRECDGWTTDVPPRTLEEARDRCRARLELIRKEEAESLPEEECPNGQAGVACDCSSCLKETP